MSHYSFPGIEPDRFLENSSSLEAPGHLPLMDKFSRNRPGSWSGIIGKLKFWKKVGWVFQKWVSVTTRKTEILGNSLDEDFSQDLPIKVIYYSLIMSQYLCNVWMIECMLLLLLMLLLLISLNVIDLLIASLILLKWPIVEKRSLRIELF